MTPSIRLLVALLLVGVLPACLVSNRGRGQGGGVADGDAGVDSAFDTGGDDAPEHDAAPDTGREDADDVDRPDAPVEADVGSDADGGREDADDVFDAELDADADIPECLPGEHRCDGDVLHRCEGGSFVSDSTCFIGCDAALGRCLHLLPSNFEAALLSLAAGNLAIESSIVLDTTTCPSDVFDVPGVAVGVMSLHDGRNACVVTAATVVVEEGGELRATGDNPLIVAAAGDIVVRGRIDAGARGSVPGAGGGSPLTLSSGAVLPCQGGLAQCDEGSGHDAGGGGGGHGSPGGLGGRSCGGAVGERSGEEELEPLTRGCGGANGQTGDGLGGGVGGAGGGALQLTSATIVEIAATGRVVVGGGGGGGAGLYSGAGGGGSGGSALLEAPVVIVAGNVAANGGGGGAGSDGGNGADGGDGPARAAGGTPVSDDGGAGGRGGAAGSPRGEDGGSEGWNGGGAGGGAGRVRINSLSGAATVTGVVSPSTVATFTEGVVATF